MTRKPFKFLPLFYSTTLAHIHEGRRYPPILYIYDELLQWPEAKDLLKPTSDTAFQVEIASEPQHLAEVAVKISKLARNPQAS